MLTTNQKPTVDTQKLEREQHKHTSKENHHTTREDTNRRTEKNYKNNQKCRTGQGETGALLR